MKGNRKNLDTGGSTLVQTPVYLDSSLLRKALRSNIVSFPSQVPVFLKQPPADVQWRVVLLFFVRGWSSSLIGARFGVPKHQIWRILKDWSIRALTLGYVQVIDRDAFALLCNKDPEYGLQLAHAASVGTAGVPLFSRQEEEVFHAIA